jgi:hypothetical protein
MSGVERKTCMTREDATISAASDFRNAPAHRGSVQGMLDHRGNHGGSETMRRAGRAVAEELERFQQAKK